MRHIGEFGKEVLSASWVVFRVVYQGWVFRVAVGFQESRPGGNAPLPFMGRTTDKGRFRFHFRFRTFAGEQL